MCLPDGNVEAWPGLWALPNFGGRSICLDEYFEMSR